MALVVEGRRAGLVVHHKFHALRVCVAVEFLNVEVGIRCLEVEHIVFIVTEPVLPTDVPTLYEHLLQAVLCCEVDVAFHVGSVGGVLSVGLTLGVVEAFEMHRWQIGGVTPLASAGNHLPPHATVLCGVNP